MHYISSFFGWSAPKEPAQKVSPTYSQTVFQVVALGNSIPSVEEAFEKMGTLCRERNIPFKAKLLESQEEIEKHLEQTPFPNVTILSYGAHFAGVSKVPKCNKKLAVFDPISDPSNLLICEKTQFYKTWKEGAKYRQRPGSGAPTHMMAYVVKPCVATSCFPIQLNFGKSSLNPENAFLALHNWNQKNAHLTYSPQNLLRETLLDLEETNTSYIIGNANDLEGLEKWFHSTTSGTVISVFFRDRQEGPGYSVILKNVSKASEEVTLMHPITKEEESFKINPEKKGSLADILLIIEPSSPTLKISKTAASLQRTVLKAILETESELSFIEKWDRISDVCRASGVKGKLCSFESLNDLEEHFAMNKLPICFSFPFGSSWVVVTHLSDERVQYILPKKPAESVELVDEDRTSFEKKWGASRQNIDPDYRLWAKKLEFMCSYHEKEVEEKVDQLLLEVFNKKIPNGVV